MSKLRGRVFLIGIILTFILIFVSGALLALRNLSQSVNQLTAVFDLDLPASPDATVVRFEVRPGDSAAVIGERLESSKIVHSALNFRLLARAAGVESRLAAGQYELRPNMRPSEILALMEMTGPGATGPVTFPEGWSTLEMADRLEAAGVVTRTEFLNAARVGNYPFDFLAERPLRSSLEGYLFPDTYALGRQMSGTAVVDAMLRTFDRRFDISMRQQAERAGLTVAQVVVLASIVEREAVLAAERPMIAEVFLNRMALKMPLQADATVQYALLHVDEVPAQRSSYWKTELSMNDLQLDSPYNTYKNRALPPGAICNPGLAALKAVLSPTSTGYLYFVAKQDGSHAFARTLEEHDDNVAQYRDSANGSR